MGSWDETCAISHLPIRPGQEVVCLLLQNNLAANFKSGPGFYSNDYFNVCSPPLFGTYEDYGQISLASKADEDLFRRFLTLLKANLIETENFLITNKTTFADLETAIYDGYVVVNANYLLHESMINSPDESDVALASTVAPLRPAPIHKVLILHSVWNEIAGIQAPANLNGDIRDPVITLGDFFTTKVRPLQMLELTNLFRELGIENRLYCMDVFTFTCKFFEGLVSELDDEALRRIGQKYIDRLVQFGKVETCLRSNRMAWFPTIGTGSQLQNQIQSVDLHALLLKHAINKTLEYANDDEYSKEEYRELYKNINNTLSPLAELRLVRDENGD